MNRGGNRRWLIVALISSIGLLGARGVTGDGDWTIAWPDMFAGVPGNVGIGTQTPQYKLEVAGTVRSHDLLTEGPWVDVRAFGAVGDGRADDSMAIQAAIDQVPNRAVILLPAGKTFYLGTTGIVINKPLTIWAWGSRVTYAGTGAAVEFNNGGPVLLAPQLFGLEIMNTQRDWVTENIGLRLRNVYEGHFEGFRISNFKYGVYLIGEDSGAVYNYLKPGSLLNNFYQVYLTALGGGWANQNEFVGGRWWYNTGASPGEPTRPTHIYVDGHVRSKPNGNLFLHNSLEAIGLVNAFVIGGNYNVILNCRVELVSDGASVRDHSRITGDYNTVMVHSPYLYLRDIANTGKGNTISTVTGSHEEMKSFATHAIRNTSPTPTFKLWNTHSGSQNVVEVYDPLGAKLRYAVNGVGQQTFFDVHVTHGRYASPPAPPCNRGDIVWNAQPVAGGPAGWMCVIDADQQSRWAVIATLGP